MNAYILLVGVSLAFLFTVGIEAALIVLLGIMGFALIFACMTAPIWITYYIAKAIHEWTNTKR